MEYSAGRTSPELFKKWTGIFCLGTSMERRVWIQSQSQNLYPTQYILFVAPSGTGKSNSTSIAQDMLNDNTGLIRAPTSLSRASLIDSLNEAVRNGVVYTTPTTTFSFNSLYVVANELGVLIPAYDLDFMSTLTDIYDGKPYEEKKRSKEIHNTIERPQINMLAGATPSYLSLMMPEAAWDQGFISRVIMVWADEVKLQDPFDENALPEAKRKELVADIRTMTKLAGQFTIAPEARQSYLDWYNNGQAPIPNHPRLIAYNTRRPTHLLKLAMITSMSRSYSLVITMQDYLRAKDILVEVEQQMIQIFPALSSGGDAKAIDDIWHQLVQIYGRKKEPMLAELVFNLLSARLPVHGVERGYQLMIKRGLIKEVQVNKVGVCVIPMMPQPMDRK